MVLVIACALELYNPSIEKKSFVHIESHGANPETRLITIDYSAFRLQFRDEPIQIAFFQGPQQRLIDVHLLRECALLAARDRLRCTRRASNRVSRGTQQG